MTWQKGQSGNPSGRTLKLASLQRRLEGLTLKAVDALENVLNDPNATHGERMSAAREVFDRAIGKPKQQATLQVTHDASPHLTALVGLAAAVALKGTNVPEIDAQTVDFIDVSGNDAHTLIEHVDAETGAEHGD